MIITKKEFKDAARKVIIEAVKETRDPRFTEEENKVADKKIATGMTEFYSKLIVKLYGQIMKNGYTTKKKHLITQIQS